MSRRKSQNKIWYVIVPIVVAVYALAQSHIKGEERTTEIQDEAKTEQTEEELSLNLRNVVKTGKKAILIEHKGYTLEYSTKHNTPVWVAWELTSNEVNSDVANRKNSSFMADDDLPYECQVTTSDYTNSGYDRGHMCPAADMKWDADAMHDCFYMSNICPQTPVLNQRHWERLESACRRWAKNEGSIYIACGPVYTSSQPSHIGREHMIAIPDGFFKVVISLAKGNEKGIGFYYANSAERQTMESASHTIDEVEELTGYDFFTELPDELENRLESMNDIRSWN